MRNPTAPVWGDGFGESGETFSWVTISAAYHAAPPGLPLWALSRPRPGGSTWLGFRYTRDTVAWGVLTCTCHSHIIGHGAHMITLERVIRTAADRGAVILTMEEAVLEFQQPARQPARAKACKPARQRMKSLASIELAGTE